MMQEAPDEGNSTGKPPCGYGCTAMRPAGEENE